MAEKFYKLPQDIAARKDLNASAKIILAVILDHMGKNSKCWPSKRTLTVKTGLSGQTVLDAIENLESVGCLVVERRGNGKSNHYKSGLQTGLVEKLDRSKNNTIGGQESRPEAVKKLDPNQTDLLNQTKYSPNSIEYEISSYLLNFILDRKPDFKKPNLQKWSKVVNHMIRIDNRKPERIRTVIEWSQQNNFWQNNILSPEKLRKQFDRLELQKEQSNRGTVSTGISAADIVAVEKRGNDG